MSASATQGGHNKPVFIRRTDVQGVDFKFELFSRLLDTVKQSRPYTHDQYYGH